MIFSQTPLSGSYLIGLEPVTDERGWFARYFSSEEFKAIGLEKQWVQLNHSVTNKIGAIRGMHYQLSPFCETKMVRCIAGAIFDVIIDLRKDSATYLKWYGIELSALNKRMLYIPEGFAHGFQSLADNCELLYHHTEYYTPKAEAGIRYDDPALQITWPMPVSILSERDTGHALLDKNFKGI